MFIFLKNSISAILTYETAEVDVRHRTNNECIFRKKRYMCENGPPKDSTTHEMYL